MRCSVIAFFALGAATLSIAASNVEESSPAFILDQIVGLGETPIVDYGTWGAVNSCSGWPVPVCMIYDIMHFPAALLNWLHDIFAGKSFWDKIVELGTNVPAYGDTLFRHAMKLYPSERITEFKESVRNTVSTANALRQAILQAAEKKEIHLDTIKEELGSIFSAIFDELKEQFPPPEEAPTHENRMIMINMALNLTGECILRFAIKLGISEELVRSQLSSLKSHVQYIVVTIGDLVEQHPELAITLLFATIAMLLPEYWLLIRVLRMIGFGPLGPVKGGVAAWLQRWLFGPTVPKGKWFALLQRLGMVLAKP